MIIKFQPAPRVDHITEDGHELTQVPYPLYTDAKGMVQQQTLVKGGFVRIVGFQQDLAESAIDLSWPDALRDPHRAIGMYVVTADAAQNLSTHLTAVETVEITHPRAETPL